MDTTQQTVEARVGPNWVESRIHFQIAEKRRAFAIGIFKGCDGPFVLAEAQINHRELVGRRKITVFERSVNSTRIFSASAR